jgi:hypothetical protein
MPVAVGWAADQFGLGILPWLLAASGVLFCGFTLALAETAPKVLERRPMAWVR